MKREIRWKRTLNDQGDFIETPTYFIDKVEVTEEVFNKTLKKPSYAKPKALPPCKIPARWPLVSRAMGVHPKQKAEAEAYDASIGVPTEYNARGMPILRDKGHRRAYLRAHKAHDQDSYD